MRKKLLALVMCATMILGSSVVATAAPSEDDYKNAKSIYSNSKNFTNELFKENATVKETVWVKSVQSNVTFGFLLAESADGSHEAIKLNDAGKPLLYVGDAKDFTATEYGTVGVNNVTIDSLIQKYVDDNSLDATKTVDKLGLNKIIYKAKDIYGEHVLYASIDATALGNAVNNGGLVYNKIAELTMKEVSVIKDGVYVTEKVCQTADGYSFVETDDKLFAADTKSVKGAGIKCVKYDIADAEAKYIPTLAKALELGTITKDAVAVKLTAYSVVGDKDVKGSLKLSKVTTPTSGYTVTSLSDLLSRTALTGSVNIFKFNEESPVTDYEMGAAIYPIGTVASNVSIADKSFTFDVAFTGDSDVIIFDQATADNAGQSDADATKPATDNASSPKTGDVAPIAALAVVMMGAFGAMVVASKKRA